MIYTPAFWAMALANLCHTASFSVFFLLPLYVLEAGGSQGDVGMVMGLFAMASALCRPWISQMIDHIGRKRSYSLGCALMLICPLLYLGFDEPLGTVYPLFLLLRALHGIGLAICFTAVFTFMADILPPNRLNEGIGMFGISGLIGIALGPVFGEVALNRFGFTGLFLLAAALATIALGAHQPLQESAPQRQPSVSPGGFFRLLGSRKFLVVGLLSLIFGTGLAATTNFVAPLAEERNLGFVSAFFFCYSAGAIGIRLLGGKLADEWGERTILPYGIVCYIAGLLLLPLITRAWMLGMAGILAGVGHGLLFPLLNTMAVRDEPAINRGKATGIFTGGIDTGNFAGSIVLGYIGNGFGMDVLFYCAGLVMAMTFLLFRFHDQRQRS